MSASRRMFGSLWNAATAHEHRRQDGCSRRPGTMAKRQTTTGGRTWPPRSGRVVALVASAADRALVSSGVLNGLQPVHQSFQVAEEQQVAVVQAAGNERLEAPEIFRNSRISDSILDLK